MRQELVESEIGIGSEQDDGFPDFLHTASRIWQAVAQFPTRQQSKGIEKI
ncbi:hypothetical protein [Burkholderia ubonensis]|nr:hypothetical protein [Burkholderia ubonensis]